MISGNNTMLRNKGIKKREKLQRNWGVVQDKRILNFQ